MDGHRHSTDSILISESSKQHVGEDTHALRPWHSLANNSHPDSDATEESRMYDGICR